MTDLPARERGRGARSPRPASESRPQRGVSAPPLHRSRVRAVGGTLRHPDVGDESWAVRPLDPIDFEPRPGLPGWPFDREQLDIYYPRAHLACGFAAADTDPAGWPDEEGPLLPLDETDVETGLFRFVPATFHHAWGELRPVGERPAVPAQSGSSTSSSGRRAGAWDEVLVRRFRRFPLRRARPCRRPGHRRGRERPHAAGHRRRRGLGNEHDLVGRYFAERLSTHAGHIVATRADLGRGHCACTGSTPAPKGRSVGSYGCVDRSSASTSC